MANKFEKSLRYSNKDIKKKRASLISAQAEDDSARYVQELRDEVRKYQKDILNLEDFYPESKVTLNVTSDQFNSATWIKQLNELRVGLALAEQKLKIAENIHQEYFG